MLTSFNPNSGKTFIVSNLSIALTFKKKKTLVIDLDMRKRSLSALVGKHSKGLSNYLGGYVDDYHELIKPVPEVPNLKVLPADKVPPNPTELNIKNKTPTRLTNTPPIFLKVIGSLRTTAATNMVIMGVQVLAMLKSMEVVMVMAFRKLIWVRKRPSMEATKICKRSFTGTFSFGMKSDSSQNRIVAPVALKQNKSMGVNTLALEMFLQQTMLSPKMQ
jgi:hypothetical protein